MGTTFGKKIPQATDSFLLRRMVSGNPQMLGGPSNDWAANIPRDTGISPPATREVLLTAHQCFLNAGDTYQAVYLPYLEGTAWTGNATGLRVQLAMFSSDGPMYMPNNGLTGMPTTMKSSTYITPVTTWNQARINLAGVNTGKGFYFSWTDVQYQPKDEVAWLICATEILYTGGATPDTDVPTTANSLIANMGLMQYPPTRQSFVAQADIGRPAYYWKALVSGGISNITWSTYENQGSTSNQWIMGYFTSGNWTIGSRVIQHRTIYGYDWHHVTGRST